MLILCRRFSFVQSVIQNNADEKALWLTISEQAETLTKGYSKMIYLLLLSSQMRFLLEEAWDVRKRLELDQIQRKSSSPWGCWGPGQAAQRSCGCRLPGSVQGHVGRCLEHPGLVEGVPGRGRGGGNRWSIRCLPAQTILWFCEFALYFPLRFWWYTCTDIGTNVSFIRDMIKWEYCYLLKDSNASNSGPNFSVICRLFF